MARRRVRPMFDTLWDAIRDGTAADVRAMIAASGGIPDDREEPGDPTPLMYAAALGHLDDVQALVEAGADVNETAEPDSGIDLPDLPFVGDASMSALVYAVGYGRDDVAAFLGPLTAVGLRRDAETVAAGRRDYLCGLSDRARTAFLRKCDGQVSDAESERRALLRDHPKLARWVIPCGGCRRMGYLPKMPREIDTRGTADQARQLFGPLSADTFACERCQAKVERAERKAEALIQKRFAELPPHVKIEVVRPKPRKKRPSADA